MTESATETVIDSKSGSNHQKKITLTLIGGKRWEAEFIGVISRRDIQKLNRVLHVEYAKVQRRRSTIKILSRDNLDYGKEKPVVKVETDKNMKTDIPKSSSKPVPKDITNAS